MFLFAELLDCEPLLPLFAELPCWVLPLEDSFRVFDPASCFTSELLVEERSTRESELFTAGDELFGRLASSERSFIRCALWSELRL